MCNYVTQCIVTDFELWRGKIPFVYETQPCLGAVKTQVIC